MDSKSMFTAERAHHDRWASEIDFKTLRVREIFEGSTSPENRFIMSYLGDIEGKRILDLGCGAGERAAYFAMKGTHCDAANISAMMLQVVQRLAERFGVELRTHVMPAEESDFDDNTFDYVYAANLLHHLNPPDALSEMRRVTKPGGKSVSGTHSNTIPY